MLLKRLSEKGLIHPPRWLPDNCHMLVVMGSTAYGCADEDSDNDIYGFAIPPKDDIFPHLKGEILGFGRQINRFEQWQQHGVEDKEAGKDYDFQVFSIVKYFNLVLENNPNMLDSLFVPQRCVIHSTQIGNLVRENRKIFLHKGCWPKFKGYSFSQAHKMTTKNPEGKRKEIRDRLGWDVKFGLHVVRLLSECEQILTEGDLDLERNREQLKAIRRGEWTQQQVLDYFALKEKQLEEAYSKSALPWGPDEPRIKKLLLECLEIHFGSLSAVVTLPDRCEAALRQIAEICAKNLDKKTS